MFSSLRRFPAVALLAATGVLSSVLPFANASAATYTLSVANQTDNGSITGTGINCGAGESVCSNVYSAGTKVKLQATANEGYWFTGWFGECYATGMPDGVCELTMNGDYKEVAEYAVDVPNFTGLWWNQAESGWGVNFTHDNEMIFATWFTYDGAGKPTWYTAEMHRSLQPGAGTNYTYAGTLYANTGAPYTEVDWPEGDHKESPVGTMRVRFSDAGHGQVTFVVNGISSIKSIILQVWGKQPTCRAGSGWNPVILTTNFQGLWWESGEPGWGISFAHQDDTIFATWFTYNEARQPLWFAATLQKTATINAQGHQTYAGNIFTVAGLPFDVPRWDASKVKETTVGNGVLSVYDGYNLVWKYTINGVAAESWLTRQHLYGVNPPTCW